MGDNAKFDASSGWFSKGVQAAENETPAHADRRRRSVYSSRCTRVWMGL